MRRFYVPQENINNSTASLGEDETRHLRDALRLRSGDEVRIFDGNGREFTCTIAAITKRSTELEISSEVAPAAPESPLELTLAVALLKGEKYDLVIQKAVELGVTRFIPLQTARCDVKLKDAGKKIERWRKIALEACKQSGRAKLMQISEPADLNECLIAAENAVLFSERGGEKFTAIIADKKITALIGPEGGWESFELSAAHDAGCLIVTLGGRILRAETAAISIAALLQHRFGDLS